MNVTSPSKSVGAFHATIWLAALAVFCGLSLAGIAQSKAAETENVKAYPIEHVKVTEIEATLASLLPAGTQMAIDSRANQVWVRGSSQIHQVAQQVVRSLDTPAPQSVPQPVQHAPPELKTYAAATPEEATALAARWNAQHGGTPGVRIVADTRTARVLVVAPADVHTAIGQSGTGFQPAKQHGQDGRATLPGGREVVLRQTTVDSVHKRLAELLGPRLTPTAGTLPGTNAYQLRVDQGDPLTLTLDYRRNSVRIEGPEKTTAACVELVELLDDARQGQSATDVTQFVPLQTTRPADARRTVDAIRTANVNSLVSMRMQQPAAPEEDAEVTEQMPQGRADIITPDRSMVLEVQPEAGSGLTGPVQIEVIEGLNQIFIRGRAADVAKVRKMIEQIEAISAQTQPSIEVRQLEHAPCEAMAALIAQLYTDVYAIRQGTVSITALIKPNSLLVIGQPESVKTVLDLIERLDVPVAPESQFRVFRLQHAGAQTVAETIQAFYEGAQAARPGQPAGAQQQTQVGLAAQVSVTADVRSNSLIVQASPRDMLEVAAMIARIDTPTSDTVNELRLIQLKNTLASELAATLQAAISGAAGPAGAAVEGGAATTAQRSTMLRFVTLDAEGHQQLSSGILSDVQITADTRTNALLVSAPSENMPLLVTLVEQLDRLPAAEAQIKVFTVRNGAAENLRDMLENFFSQQQQEGQPAVRTAATEQESTLVPLRFAVDQRTNSIIASGTLGDLAIVDAILTTLDSADAKKRRSMVYRLKNALVLDVAQAINEYLAVERDRVNDLTGEFVSPYEQIEREVVVVPEQGSNSLIISATPEYYEEIEALVRKLDEQAPMVMIQVLIAQVQLNDTDEFGVELGLQDSVLFDRSLLGNLVEVSQTTQTAAGQVENQVIVGASNTPGFLFNNQQLGNSGASNALANAATVGTQGLSHFDLGRINSDLGYGGLVLAASSESVSMLLRALKQQRRIEILSRPQIMALDNQEAYVVVGQDVPIAIGTQTTESGSTQTTINRQDVGLIINVRPRINPDGLVTMIIQTENSSLAPEAEGIPISIAPNGDAVRSPVINKIQARTTVNAMDGQTVVLGGLITSGKTKIERRVPLLSNIPVLGNVFRYDYNEKERTELLIIMTPHIATDPEEADKIRQAEVARMHWCLGDVLEMTGDRTLRGRTDEWSDMETNVVYPDGNPYLTPPEPVPTPAEESPFLAEPGK